MQAHPIEEKLSSTENPVKLCRATTIKLNMIKSLPE
jgi:hypothetical protein